MVEVMSDLLAVASIATEEQGYGHYRLEMLS